MKEKYQDLGVSITSTFPSRNTKIQKIGEEEEESSILGQLLH